MSVVSEYIVSLGGYETAKEKSTPWLLNHGENWRNVKDATLLEYRREHNIYEEGDKVVMISKRRAPKLWTWIHTTNWRPNHSLLDCGENLLYPFSNDEFRHATDAEIDANRRLDL